MNAHVCGYDDSGYLLNTHEFVVFGNQFGTHILADHAIIAKGGAYMSHLGNVDVGT